MSDYLFYCEHSKLVSGWWTRISLVSGVGVDKFFMDGYVTMAGTYLNGPRDTAVFLRNWVIV